MVLGRLTPYNGFGLVLAVSSTLLAIFTYVSFGFGPLFSLWIGLLIVGASVALTPMEEGFRLSEFSSKMILNVFENVARVIEGLNIRGEALFIERNSDVYIVVGNAKDVDVSKFVILEEGKPVFIFKSPISREHLEGYTDTCTALEHVIVDRLGFAETIECIDRGGEIAVRLSNIKVYPIKSLEKSIGSIYGVVAASIAALIKGSPAKIGYERCNDRECYIRVDVLGEKLE